jgi:hypothetical protein
MNGNELAEKAVFSVYDSICEGGMRGADTNHGWLRAKVQRTRSAGIISGQDENERQNDILKKEVRA